MKAHIRFIGRSAVFAILLIVSAVWGATNSAALLQIDSRDFGDTNYLMKVVELERHTNISKLKFTYQKRGSSVGSTMFVVRGFYEVAKARGAEYFINLKEWPDTNRGTIYIAGFTNTKKADLKKEFGEQFDYVNEHGQKRELLSVSDYKVLFDSQERAQSCEGSQSVGRLKMITTSRVLP